MRAKQVKRLTTSMLAERTLPVRIRDAAMRLMLPYL